MKEACEPVCRGQACGMEKRVLVLTGKLVGLGSMRGCGLSNRGVT